MIMNALCCTMCMLPNVTFIVIVDFSSRCFGKSKGKGRLPI